MSSQTSGASQYQLHEALSWAESELPTGDIPPTFIGIKGTKRHTMVVPTESVAKERALCFLNFYTLSQDLDEYIMVNLGWMLVMSVAPGITVDDAEKKIHEYGSIKGHPDRIECLSAIYCSRTGKKSMVVKKVLRDGEKFLGLEEIELPESGLVSGEFSGFFAPNDTEITDSLRRTFMGLALNLGLKVVDTSSFN